MGVPKDYRGKSRGMGIQIQVVARVDHVEQFSAELDGFGCRQFTADAVVVDVASNCGEWRDRLQRFENIVAADIAGMQDVIATH